MKVISLNAFIYGFGDGRYRCMKDESVVAFFLEQGWKPKYTAREREIEVQKRMGEGLTRSEAEFEVDDDINSDLEDWVQMNFSKTLVC
jgi:hypothetical protein